MRRLASAARLLLALFLMASLPLRGYAVGMLVPPVAQTGQVQAHETRAMPADAGMAHEHAAHAQAASAHAMQGHAAHDDAAHDRVAHEPPAYEHAAHEHTAADHAAHEHPAHGHLTDAHPADEHTGHDHARMHASHLPVDEAQMSVESSVIAHHGESRQGSHSSCGPCADCCSVGALQSLPLAVRAQPAPHRVEARPALSPASFIADLLLPPPNPLAA